MSAIVKGMLGLICVNAVLGLVQLTNKQFGLVGCNWWVGGVNYISSYVIAKPTRLMTCGRDELYIIVFICD